MRRVEGASDVFITSLQIVAQNRGVPDEPALIKPAVAGGNDVELRLSGMLRCR
ncbi:hypothetical protein AB395_00006783 (plasmid) [Sinorhizobium fredii CCBAU 45436]|nr:hypothetical protein AB395_00006783 [Sinorhizobium fredii CCBAU 45436]